MVKSLEKAGQHFSPGALGIARQASMMGFYNKGLVLGSQLKVAVGPGHMFMGT